MWPFKKKTVEEKQQKTDLMETKEVIISSNDSGMRRAEIAMRHAGFNINSTMYNQLPWIAQVFDAYKKLDYNDGLKNRKKLKNNNTDQS